MRTRWPWISLLTAIVAIVSPLGREVIHNAFFSGEQLSRNIAQPFFLIGLAILILMGALEWLVRLVVFKRRARGATI
jgi:hypothetical protein